MEVAGEPDRVRLGRGFGRSPFRVTTGGAGKRFDGAVAPRDGTLLGHLFESLVTLSVKVYAQAAEAEVRHLRTEGGRHEVDLVVVRPDGRVLALEVKVAGTVCDDDVKHLLWLRERLGDDLVDVAVITTGPAAYRRSDGIGVIPAVCARRWDRRYPRGGLLPV